MTGLLSIALGKYHILTLKNRLNHFEIFTNINKGESVENGTRTKAASRTV